MFPVKFGNGPALEIRDIKSRAMIYYTIGMAIGSKMPLPDWDNTFADVCANKLNEFVDMLWSIIVTDLKYQWVLFCSDFEFMQDSEKFEEKCLKLFTTPSQTFEPLDEDGRKRASLSKDKKLRPRCWFVDTLTGQIFHVRFRFTSPIHVSTVLEGTITPSGEIPDDLDSEKCVSLAPTFQIRHVHQWCGAAPPVGDEQFVRQQLNVWFNTPSTEQCWFRPDQEKDCVKFYVDIVSADSPERMKLPVLTTIPEREKKEELICVKWTDVYRISSSGVFRIYKTQYPFIYTLMPDDDQHVEAIKTQLLVEGYQPLVLTIPTSECELLIRNDFLKHPKHKFVKWRCGNFNGKWIPLNKE